MGCTQSSSLPGQEDPQTIHVPFGHVPYSPSLPGVMGPLSHFPMEWWFYGGWASDADDTKQFTILLYTLRVLIDGGIMYGVGVKDASGTSFTAANYNIALGQFPTPTATEWSTNVESPHARMNCKLVSGTLGLSGAMYEINFRDLTNNVHATLILESNVGLVQEGSSGAFPGIDTVQFAMPVMSIQEGSKITLNGVTTELAKGNIWLERQSVKLFNIFKPIYLGAWLAITMNDGTSYTVSFYWPKREEKGTQWIVGTDVGYPPTSQTALEYPALKTWDGSAPIQGVNVLVGQEYDLNILNPSDPSSSPHWTSSNKQGNTYCSAWNLKLKTKMYKMVALVPESEVFLDTYFFEGTAMLYDDTDTVVGHAFVEQMGYN